MTTFITFIECANATEDVRIQLNLVNTLLVDANLKGGHFIMYDYAKQFKFFLHFKN